VAIKTNKLCEVPRRVDHDTSSIDCVFGGQERQKFMLARSAIQSAFFNDRSEATNGCRHSDLAFQELLQDGKRKGFTKFHPPLLSPPPRGASFLPRKPLLQSVVRSGHVVLVGADDTGKDLKESCSCFRGKQSELLVDIWVTVCNCCLVLLEIIIVMYAYAYLFAYLR